MSASNPTLSDSNQRPSQYCDPKAFFDFIGLPGPTSYPTVTPAEVRQEALVRSSKILADYGLLNRLLDCCEATIRKRWLKRTRAQRARILSIVWPNMPTVHRPDLDCWLKDGGQNPQDKGAFMWPHINQEDLLNPKILPIFLNARGRHPPCAFITADYEAARLGETCGMIRPAFLNEHVMIFTGRTTPQKYGELINWCDHEDAFDLLFTQKGMHPGMGLISLEIQERLYTFLVNCCMQLLEDTHMETLLSDETSIQPEPPALSTSQTGMNLQVVVAAEAPYRLPAGLDIRRLRSIFSAKRAAAEDHLWALREDPAYFADTVLNEKEHRQELIPDALGRLHHLTKSHKVYTLWNRILNRVVSDAYFLPCFWNEIERQLADIEALLSQHKQDLQPENDLPKDLEWAFCRLILFLEKLVEAPLRTLQTEAPASLPLRPFFERVDTELELSGTIINVVPKASLGVDKRRWRLFRLLQALWDKNASFLIGLHVLVDELETLIEKDKFTKGLFSPNVLDTFSGLSVLSLCQRQLSGFQPWAATFETTMANQKDNLENDFRETVKDWKPYAKVGDGTDLAGVGNPTDGRFYYPVDKRRTRESTAAMQQAEANLDAFWRRVDTLYTDNNGLSLHAAVRNLLSNERILARTPDWVDEPAPPTSSDASDTETGHLPLSQVCFELERRTKQTIQPDRPSLAHRPKPKTRGTARLSHSTAIPADDASSQHGPDIQPTFAVDKRALKTFSTVFHAPSRTSQPGEVAWTDFLHAMASTGFSAEKLYGSIWQFTPRALDTERGIQFHEPHPRGKLPFRMARRRSKIPHFPQDPTKALSIAGGPQTNIFDRPIVSFSITLPNTSSSTYPFLTGESLSFFTSLLTEYKYLNRSGNRRAYSSSSLRKSKSSWVLTPRQRGGTRAETRWVSTGNRGGRLGSL
ncbi:hypothetical protein P168DRAFT_302141 [Aspergillus campestris IBT 28561]|uniref:Uncharacterized protein n=1 Tax=Aspergillus campestris (strain IBT 28561) TaxID=1392248 RepID=A0A2I1DBC5_ASPC2|nr:uncharacterized protein P168DRAFT_302141 [Aspergillus campestris IBT 28561]PKY07165.1 hypothetical protein P168DRAFT_302141 [Aspergillus campestris IBT 28561]